MVIVWLSSKWFESWLENPFSWLLEFPNKILSCWSATSLSSCGEIPRNTAASCSGQIASTAFSINGTTTRRNTCWISFSDSVDWGKLSLRMFWTFARNWLTSNRTGTVRFAKKQERNWLNATTNSLQRTAKGGNIVNSSGGCSVGSEWIDELGSWREATGRSFLRFPAWTVFLKLRNTKGHVKFKIVGDWQTWSSRLVKLV